MLSWFVRAVARSTDITVYRDHKPILAVGGLLTWATLTQHFRHYARNFVLIRTLRNGLASFARFILGCAPVFMAFCMFAVVVFGDSTYRYDGTFHAALTMFCVSGAHVCQLHGAVMAL